MGRAYSPSEILKMNHKEFAFTGEWKDAFGAPEMSGVWFIWGNSGNGKTNFIMQLVRELSRFGKVAINALEERQSKTIKDAIRRFGLDDLDGKLQFLSEPMSELTGRLLKRRSVDFVVIDSFQYTQMTYRQYIDFKKKHPTKLLIFISHASGTQPSSRASKSVMYDADLKIWVEGWRAHSKGRYIGEKGYFDIWKEKALEYWGE